MRGMALGRSRRVGRYKLHAAFKGQPPAGEGRDGSGNSARNRLRRFPVACAVGVAPLPTPNQLCDQRLLNGLISTCQPLYQHLSATLSAHVNCLISDHFAA